jgi:hypothetical protein
MKIGRLSFGIRTKTLNKRYLIPRDTVWNTHPYFKFFVWWLWFYIAKPKKCPICGEYLTGKGEFVQYDLDSGERNKTMCYPCAEKLKEPKYIF